MRFCPVPIRLPATFILILGLLGGAPMAAAWTPEGLFAKHCAACHGERGDGQSRARSGLNPPPRSFTSEQTRGELDRDRMIRSVTHGRPDTAMVGWEGRLSDAQIAAVVDFIRAKFMGLGEAAPVLAAASPAALTAAPASTPKVPGDELYKQHCAACHGDRGAGASWTLGSLDPPPRDFTRETLPRERMRKSVTEGRPGTAMMSFASRLSAAEIDAVVDFIRAEFMRAADAPAPSAPAQTARTPARSPHAAPSAPPQSSPAPVPALPAVVEAADISLPFPGGLSGNPVSGGDFYMKNCHVCHGSDGDGKGPRSSFIRPAPRDFLSGESRRALNRPALYKAIAAGMRGTVMPAWRTVLSEQEIADVAEFVFQAYIDAGGEGASLLEAAKKKALN